MAKASSSCGSEQWSTCRTSFQIGLFLNFAKLVRVVLAIIVVLTLTAFSHLNIENTDKNISRENV